MPFGADPVPRDAEVTSLFSKSLRGGSVAWC